MMETIPKTSALFPKLSPMKLGKSREAKHKFNSPLEFLNDQVILTYY